MAKILRMTKVELGKTKAFFTAAIGEWEIEGLRLIEGKNGFFVGFPSRSYKSPKDDTTKYVDVVRTTSKTILKELLEAAIVEYDRKEGVKATTSKSTDLSLDDDDTEDLPF